MEDIVIIGGQAGGMTLAMRILKNNPNANITIIEEQDFISFGACGLPYYIGDFFTNPNNMFARKKQDVISHNFNILDKHSAYEIDSEKQIVKIKNLTTDSIIEKSYDKLIIATGSSAKQLPKNIDSSKRSYILKNLNDAEKIKAEINNLINNSNQNNSKKVAIIGAGYIGLELLEALIPFDLDITIFDSKNKLTDNLLDGDFEEILHEELLSHQINMKLNTKIISIIDENNQVKIQYQDSNNNNNVENFNFIITALGFSPNTKFLENLNLNMLNNGAIITDNNGATNIKNIYALGDCASIHHKILQKNTYIPLATIANKQARKIADSMYGINNTFSGTIGSSCLKILDLEIAKTGICEFEAKKENIECISLFMKDYNHTDYYPNQLPLFVKLIFLPQDGTILGGQIVGKDGAMLRIHALTTAIESKLTIYQLANLDFAYAPPFNRTWDILNLAGELAIKKMHKKS
jgi:NADPH-dependent 2,4-dienoyl-CoA reductase/sulfur reductase-like enzyme